MPDIYAAITEVDQEMQERLAEVLELRAADPRQVAMLHAYLTEIVFPPEASVLEIGCGSGPVTRTLARWPHVARAVGVDPSALFIEKARLLAADIPNLAFLEADGRSLKFDSGTFDAVVVHTTLSHVPAPEQVVAEALRVLRVGGWLAVFDGDYATATVSIGNFDPLDDCVCAFRENFVHDPWLVRRLPRLLVDCGFDVMPMRCHGYVEAPDAGYMLTWIDRGADALLGAGKIDSDAAHAHKAEAQRRSIEKTWFGHIAFASILGRKPHNPALKPSGAPQKADPKNLDSRD